MRGRGWLQKGSGISRMPQAPRRARRGGTSQSHQHRAHAKCARPTEFSKWHARRDSNPQPTDLESVALPIELLAYLNHFFFSTCGVCFRQSRQNLLIWSLGAPPLVFLEVL
jgi:hypothetical protein